MSRQEAEDLVSTAIQLAMSRDGSSGGVVRLVTITETGAERRCAALGGCRWSCITCLTHRSSSWRLHAFTQWHSPAARFREKQNHNLIYNFPQTHQARGAHGAVGRAPRALHRRGGVAAGAGRGASSRPGQRGPCHRKLHSLGASRRCVIGIFCLRHPRSKKVQARK